jgi:hypothetical protein
MKQDSATIFRTAIFAALEALESGDQREAVYILLGVLEDGPIDCEAA